MPPGQRAKYCKIPMKNAEFTAKLIGKTQKFLKSSYEKRSGIVAYYMENGYNKGKRQGGAL